MITKVIDGRQQWLFPDSLNYIFDDQLFNKGWECYAFDLDSILNTMAALLTILHNQEHSSLNTDLHNVLDRSSRMTGLRELSRFAGRT